MRRLVLALTVIASLALAVAGGAIAAGSAPRLAVEGAAQAGGDKLRGGFTVANVGTARTAAITATVKLVSGGRKPTRLTVQRASIPALAPGGVRRVKVAAEVPGKVGPGIWSILACAEGCAKIGRLTASAGPGPDQKKATAPNAPTPAGAATSPVGPTPPSQSTPSPPTSTPDPACAPSTGPLPYDVEEPFHHVGECGDEYFGFVPASYDPGTPMPLLIWAHGCGGEAEGDAWNVGSYEEEAPKGWLTLSLGGRDGECWTPSVDEAKVMAALADFEAHFDVDPHRVLLGGYSSGGDLAYRAGFRHSSTFAGLLIENSSPFRDTESTEAESLAAATTKLHIVHLAHTGDTTYRIAGVRAETEAVSNAGFPITVIERPGPHYDGKTDSDLREFVLPHIEDGWTSP
jgi:hypothetical protein